MTTIAETPGPPFDAVIFTSLRAPGDPGYDRMAARMLGLAAQQPGFLGAERDQRERAGDAWLRFRWPRG
jgi:hypothetical protein